MEELWKDIPNYNGLYQASNMGNIRSLDRMVNAKNGSKCLKKGKMLIPQILHDGYYQVRLCDNGKSRQYRIHQLVAMCFVEKQKGNNQVNHIDECLTNNNASNLEWCTISYNNNYGGRIQRIKKSMKNGKNSKSVIQMDLNGKIIKEWDSMSEVQRVLGISSSKIAMCCKGKRNKTGGFKWSYCSYE